MHQKLDQGVDPKAHKGALIIAPPNTQDAQWLKKWEPYKTAAASGWMATRGARRRRGYDTGFVLSDHSDFNELNTAVKASEAESVICTHGYTEIYSKYLNSKGIRSTTADTPFEDEPNES
jgi:putative mRNA 3-end processing factor